MAVIQPNVIQVDPGGMLMATLGRGELEFVGALIIRWHQFKGRVDWSPVSRWDLAEMLKEDEVVQKWALNPFWRPDLFGFSEKGFIDGWNEDPKSKGTLTDKFHAGLAKRFK